LGDTPGGAPDPGAPRGRLARLAHAVARNARENPYVSVLFGIWAFGYMMMVPTLLGSRFIPLISERLGGAPETLFVAFAGLMLNVLVFAFLVPFLLWMLVCWALRREDEGTGASG
jgi:hypothetical protein